MNQIRAIQALNKRELEEGISPEASWHADYRDTAFIYFGGLPFELSEGDIITIFSQYGEPVFLKLVRDKETGKSKGFGWLKYEDQRSTDLAVDNLGGAVISGRMIRVDHARFKPKDDEDLEACKVSWEDIQRRNGKNVEEEEVMEEQDESDDDRPLLPEERELQLLIRDHDDDDPMKAFLVEEKKAQVAEAIRRYNRHKEKKKRKHGGHRRPLRSRRDETPDRENRSRRHRKSGKDDDRDDRRDSRERDRRHDNVRGSYRRRYRDTSNDESDNRREPHGDRRPRGDRRRYRDRADDYHKGGTEDSARRGRPDMDRSRSP